MNLLGKKSLVIYFSHTGENYMSDGIRNIDKGNTEVIAEMIKDITKADLFKVEKAIDYPYNYRECVDLASKEKSENARPKLKEYLDNLDKYDTIFVGYPSWCGTMPMVLFTQLEKLNFTNKIIKPFCTNEGSRMGSSESDIKKICKGATVLVGLPIQGSVVYESKNKVENWIK